MKGIIYIFLMFSSSPIFLFRRSSRVRALLLKLTGADIGSNVDIFKGMDFYPYQNAKNIKIGNGSFVNVNFRIGLGRAKVEIGSNVQIGPNVSIECVSHNLIYETGKGRSASFRDVAINDEVWVGAGATILGGVNIGKGAVVASGSVVTRDVEPFTLVGGVPAKLLKKIYTDEA
jgi:maltose O-acetyltransferase